MDFFENFDFYYSRLIEFGGQLQPILDTLSDAFISSIFWLEPVLPFMTVLITLASGAAIVRWIT